MTDAGSAIANLLSGTRWNEAVRTPLAGDASKRRYERLSAGGETAILMIVPPDSGENTSAFLSIARHLRSAGFSAPEILAKDDTAGLLLLEDLGDALFARLALADPPMEQALYGAAVEMLAALHEVRSPAGLPRMNARGLAEATDLAWIWYSGLGDGNPERRIEALIAQIFDVVSDLDEVLVLRDFHAENLIWLENRESHARVGLLDFQDALLGHRAYDLVSLVYDARRDLARGLADMIIDQYATMTGADSRHFAFATAAFRLQRNLRILGIFARLAMRDGKTGYLRYLPRVWRHLTEALEHPELAPLGDVVLASLPPPDPDHLARLTPQ